MRNGPCFLLFLAVLGGSGVLAEPFQVAPANPHYYSSQGKLILLLILI
jgi:hypothetical protein